MWFTEDPWYPILGCILALLVLGAMWRTNGRPVYLKIMLVIVLVACGIFVLERAIVTQPERIDADIHDLVESFRRQDLKRTLGHVSESATTERELISSAIDMVTIENALRITDMDV